MTIDDLSKKLDHEFTKIHEQFQSVDKRFSAMDERFSAMDKKFSAMDERFSAMDERFSAMDKKFSAMDKKFSAMEQTLLETKNQVEVISVNQFKAEQKYDGKIAALFDCFDIVKRKLDSVEANFNTIPHRQALTDIRFEEICLKLKVIDSVCKQNSKSIEGLGDAFAKWLMPYELRLGAVERNFATETIA